jgi:hypothetical protein
MGRFVSLEYAGTAPVPLTGPGSGKLRLAPDAPDDSLEPLSSEECPF